ncbi:hypothetical protein RRSWK_01435 [Rhodopirellula sp. SWK7]|nr:hypothetical protein RRSWK_01435 [Rhodopirellula sp. SWK7]
MFSKRHYFRNATWTPDSQRKRKPSFDGFDRCYRFVEFLGTFRIHV